MATTTSPPSSSSWKPTGRHNVYLGKSFVNSLQMRKGIQPKVNGKFPPSIYHSVRYNFRPSSIDSDAAGTLTLKTAGSEKTPVLAEHPSTQQGEMHMFNGSEIPTKDSLCTLIYNAATGHYTLEKIDSVINLDYIEKKQISAPQPSTSFEDEFAEILPDNIKPYRKEEEEEEGELLVEPFHRDPSPPIRDPSPPPKPKKAPPKSKLPPKPKLEPKAQPKPKPEPKRPKAEPKTSTSKPPTPIERAKASLKRPSPEVEEFGSITKPPPAKKARQSLSRPAPPPPPRQPAKLELPGMSSSFIQPLPGPSTFSAPAAPPTLSIPEDSDEEEDWDEVPAPGALEPSQDMDMFTQLLENQLDEEAPEDEEDFLLEGMEEIDGDGDEQEQEQEQGGPQVPMSLNQYAGVEFGVDDDDFSSSGSEDEDD